MVDPLHKKQIRTGDSKNSVKIKVLTTHCISMSLVLEQEKSFCFCGNI